MGIETAWRLAAMVLLLASAAGMVAWAWPESPTVLPDTNAVHVIIEGDGDRPWFNATVTLTNGTPLTALLAAANTTGLMVDVEKYGGFGPCGAYVAEVGGLRERRDGTGWTYHVWDEARGWVWGDRGADCWPLQSGDRVKWQWIPGGSG